MSAAAAPAKPQWKPNDPWLLGIVLAVINFWLFAQTLLNVIPGIQDALGIERTLGNLAVSITSLFSGIFIVVAGGLADRLGRVKIMNVGIYLSILGSLLIALTPENAGGLTAAVLLGGRVVQGLSAACIMPSTMALVKTYYEGKDRQRALSFWSIGSWGGSGFCSLFGGLMATSLPRLAVDLLDLDRAVDRGAVPAARARPSPRRRPQPRRSLSTGAGSSASSSPWSHQRVHLAGAQHRLAELDRHRADRPRRRVRDLVLLDRDDPAQRVPQPQAVRAT